ncbi:hypothetical protein QNI19_32190 [Cytophagaceae bacterium DM2B3-1]|uniref:Uncharacterized protein n=1 Tax=Xanthocytophaga flava TaxID=3048013 RepID=A0ABT7CV54_9BACT|nr:hypothetical protein [Xanthocytophaga flavus]MDJ1497644.1 hypothetical protein [Xanthocytophaga flavus]
MYNDFSLRQRGSSSEAGYSVATTVATRQTGFSRAFTPLKFGVNPITEISDTNDPANMEEYSRIILQATVILKEIT